MCASPEQVRASTHLSGALAETLSLSGLLLYGIRAVVQLGRGRHPRIGDPRPLVDRTPIMAMRGILHSSTYRTQAQHFETDSEPAVLALVGHLAFLPNVPEPQHRIFKYRAWCCEARAAERVLTAGAHPAIMQITAGSCMHPSRCTSISSCATEMSPSGSSVLGCAQAPGR